MRPPSLPPPLTLFTAASLVPSTRFSCVLCWCSSQRATDQLPKARSKFCRAVGRQYASRIHTAGVYPAGCRRSRGLLWVACAVTEAPSTTSPKPRQRHPYKHVSALLEDLEPHITTVDQGPNQAPIRLLPKLSDLQKAGLSALAASIGKFGGVKRLSKMVGAQPASRCDQAAMASKRLKGRTMSDVTRQRISQAKKGVTLSAGTCAKMAAGHRGKRHSTETIAKIRSTAVANWKAKELANPKAIAAQDVKPVGTPPKRKRGRPRKADTPTEGRPGQADLSTKGVQAGGSTSADAQSMETVVSELADLKRS